MAGQEMPDSALAGRGAHHFAFSTNWRDGKRLCGDCGQKYDDGDHIEVRVLDPFTRYICPVGNGQMNHSSTWSGAQDCPELRSPRDKFCVCGAEFVKEDEETWRLSWEMDTGGGWHPVSKVASRHETHTQRDGLTALIAQGEPIRNVSLVLLTEVTS